MEAWTFGGFESQDVHRLENGGVGDRNDNRLTLSLLRPNPQLLDESTTCCDSIWNAHRHGLKLSFKHGLSDLVNWDSTGTHDEQRTAWLTDPPLQRAELRVMCFPSLVPLWSRPLFNLQGLTFTDVLDAVLERDIQRGGSAIPRDRNDLPPLIFVQTGYICPNEAQRTQMNDCNGSWSPGTLIRFAPRGTGGRSGDGFDRLRELRSAFAAAGRDNSDAGISEGTGSKKRKATVSVGDAAVSRGSRSKTREAGETVLALSGEIS